MNTSLPLLLLLNTAFILGYVPINHLVKGGREPKTKLDERVPLLPFFVYPYLFAYIPWIIGLYFYYAVYFPEYFFRLTVATGIATLLGYACFLFFPTYVTCTYPEGKGFAYRLLQYVHFIDQQNNACPSMHVYMTVLLMVFSWGSIAWLNAITFLLGTSIIAATVLTKRHYLLDIAGGLGVGVIAVGAAFYGVQV